MRQGSWQMRLLFLGPPFSVNVELAEEDDGSGLDVRTGAFCVDFSDEVLAMAREFDPVPDSLETIVTFEASRPEALPMASDVLEHALKWAEEASGRTNFYSAREGPNGPPERPQGQPKKAAAKRVSNANVAELFLFLRLRYQLCCRSNKTWIRFCLQKLCQGQSMEELLQLPLCQASPGLSHLRRGALGGQQAAGLIGPFPRTRQNPSGLGTSGQGLRGPRGSEPSFGHPEQAERNHDHPRCSFGWRRRCND